MCAVFAGPGAANRLDPILVIVSDGQELVAVHRMTEPRVAAAIAIIEDTRRGKLPDPSDGRLFGPAWIKELAPRLSGFTVGPCVLQAVDTDIERHARRFYQRFILQASIPAVDVIGVPWDASQGFEPVPPAPMPQAPHDVDGAVQEMLRAYGHRDFHRGFYTHISKRSRAGGPMGDLIFVVVGTDDGATLAVARRSQEIRGSRFSQIVSQSRVAVLPDAPGRGSDGVFTREWAQQLGARLGDEFRVGDLVSIGIRDGRVEAATLFHSLLVTEPAVKRVSAGTRHIAARIGNPSAT